MSKPSAIGEIAIEYCQKHPDIPDLTLARMAHAKNKKVGSVDQFRGAIRWHRGRKRNVSKAKEAAGKRGRTASVVPSTAVVSKEAFRYRAPKSHSTPHEDFIIHGAQRILRLSDIHYPFHDERALEAAINYGIKKDPTILLLDGDIIDCMDCSDHERDPRLRTLELEMKMVGEEIMVFKSVFPKARIIWKEGNHSARLQRYLARRAPELFGLPMMDVPGFITMVSGGSTVDESGTRSWIPNPEVMRGVEWVTDKRTIRCGHIAFLHGHEFSGGGGINPARWLFLRTGESAVCGHFHRISEHSETTLSRKQVGCWSTGCLSELTPKYMPNNKWQHGFAYVEVRQDGTFHVDNIRIIDGNIIGR